MGGITGDTRSLDYNASKFRSIVKISMYVVHP